LSMVRTNNVLIAFQTNFRRRIEIDVGRRISHRQATSAGEM
jgi:hypothetical protein